MHPTTALPICRLTLALACSLIPVVAAAQTGGIAGTVTGSSGTPLADIEISALVPGANGWTTAAWTETAADGTYELGGLAADDYRLQVVDRSQVWAYQIYDGAALIGDGDVISVDDTVVTIDPVLEPAGRIQGRLTDTAGVPLEFPLIFVYTFEDDPQILFVTTPDEATGDYEVGGLATGDFIVWFTGRRGLESYSGYWDGQSWIGDADPVSVIAGQVTSGIDGEIGPPPGGYTGGIVGMVTGPDAMALPEIEVVLYQQQGADRRVVAWQNTGADGSYAFEELEDGDYTLLFRDWSQNFAFVYYGGVSRLEDASIIEIDGAQVNIDATLELAGRITGTLTDPGGRPLDDPLVFVHTAGSDPEVLFFTTPDAADGAYEMGGLPTGDYLIQFTGRQGIDSWSAFYDDAATIGEATPIPVILGEITPDIDGTIGLPPGGVVEGTITDPYGRAFDFARVEALTWDGDDWVVAGSASTAFYESEFRLPVPPGSYRLRFEAGSFLQPDLPTVEFFDDVVDVEDGTDVTVALDQLIDGFEIAVGNLATGSLSGTVTAADGGAPLAGIEVYVADRRGRVLWDQVATTAADGTYTISGLWPEAWFVELYDPAFVHQTVRLPEQVLVGEDAVTGVDAALEVASPGTLPGSISGTIIGEEGPSLFNVRVYAELVDDEVDFGAIAYTASDGSYRLRGLPTGDYLLRFSSSDGFRVPEWYDDVEDDEDAATVTVADSADTGGVDAALAPAGAISGSITDRFGGDFFIATATALVPDGDEWRQVAFTLTVSESDYRLDEIPVGTVRVRFTGSNSTNLDLVEFYDDAETIEDGVDLPVNFGETLTDIDAVLGSPPSGAITGTVTDGSGLGLDGIAVRIYTPDFELLTSVETSADGSWEAAELYDGLYYVDFSDPNGTFPAEAYDDVASLMLATPIQIVDGGTTTGVDAALDGTGDGPGGGGFRGTVTAEPGGEPLAGIHVRCFDDTFFSVPGCDAVTAADGTFELGGFLLSGDYTVRFTSSDGFWADEWYDDARFIVDATPVAASVGVWSDGLDAALTPAGGISGTVTNEVGNAFPLLTVTAFAREGDEWMPFAGDFAIGETEYEILGLPAGDYRLLFRGSSLSSPDSGIVEFYDDVETIDAGTDVPVIAGQVTVGIGAVLGGSEPGLVDPPFADGIEAWSQDVPEGSSIVHGSLDLDGDPASGSASVSHAGGPEGRLVLSQCVAAVGDQRYGFGAWLRVAGASSGGPTAYVAVDFHDQADCGGDPPMSAATPAMVGNRDWSYLGDVTVAPPPTITARIHLVIESGSTVSFEANWDQVVFAAENGLFADGFESGDLSSWSSTTTPWPPSQPKVKQNVEP